MLVQIITALGSLTTVSLAILASENKPLSSKSEYKTPSLDKLNDKQSWLLINPYENTLKWLNNLQNFLTSIGKPLTSDEYLLIKSVIMTIDWTKENPPYASPQWLYDYRKFVIDNGLKSTVIGVRNEVLHNWMKGFVLGVVGVIAAVVFPPAVVAVIGLLADKYEKGTLKPDDLIEIVEE